MASLTRNRKALIASMNLETDLESKVCNIWKEYETAIDRRVNDEGPRHALKIYKECYVFLRNYLLDLPLPSIAFCKVDKKGIPKPLWALRPLLNKGSRTLSRLALTIARSYEKIRLPIDYTTEPITRKLSERSTVQGTDQEFRLFLERFTQKYPWYLGSLRNVNSLEPKMIRTLSKGPNGPAVATAHLDALALSNDKPLLEAIIKLNETLNQGFLNQMMLNQIRQHEKSDKSKLIHSKLGFSAEPGGKTRIFAIGDYWSQSSLKVIQDSLYNTLKAISTDATRNQEKGFKSLLKKTKGKRTYCFDLSSASDRIPAIMQKHRLNLMSGKPLGEHWHSVMTKRDFHIKATKEKVRWEVGQPLGLLSSFPSFALWHHDIVQFCYNRDRLIRGLPLKFFQDYVILGDDIVIYNEKVASAYYYFMTNDLEIPINKSKSIMGNKQNSQIEFIKRLARNGKEFSSLKHNILTKNDIQSMLDLTDLMHERDFISTVDQVTRVSGILNQRDSLLFRWFYWIKSRSTLPFEGDDVACRIEREDFERKLKTLRIQKLREKAMKITEQLDAQKATIDMYQHSRIPVSPQALGLEDLSDPSMLHPIVWAINQTGMDIADVLCSIWDDEDQIDPVEYLPTVSNKSYFSRPFEGKQRYLSKLYLETYKALKEVKTV